MAAETKIGLLVGLAFIVCFAVILSHRGGGDRLSTEMAYQLLTDHRPRTTSAVPARKGIRKTRDTSEASLVDLMKPSPTVIGPPRSKETEMPVSARAETPPNATGRQNPTFETLFGQNERNPAASAEKRVNPPAETLQQPARRQPQKTRYIIESGDTLWAIAAKAYGHRSVEIVDAIFAANRDVLRSRDALRIRTEITLPRIDGADAPRMAGQERLPGDATGNAPGDLRHYQIRAGDRYTTIAERFLGDKSRWKEIHELNKDIFPDPSRIRYGVRIRLPAAARNG